MKTRGKMKEREKREGPRHTGPYTVSLWQEHKDVYTSFLLYKMGKVMPPPKVTMKTK